MMAKSSAGDPRLPDAAAILLADRSAAIWGVYDTIPLSGATQEFWRPVVTRPTCSHWDGAKHATSNTNELSAN